MAGRIEEACEILLTIALPRSASRFGETMCERCAELVLQIARVERLILANLNPNWLTEAEDYKTLLKAELVEAKKRCSEND